MSEAAAWLLDLGGGLHAAVGEREMLHLLPDPPTLYRIPQSPPYCRQVLVWEGEVLPLMELARRIPVGEGARTEAQGLIAITAFQEHPGAAPRRGALLLSAAPVRIGVNDAQACALPEPRSVWRRLAIACFEHPARGPIPVLDLARLFLLPADRSDE